MKHFFAIFERSWSVRFVKKCFHGTTRTVMLWIYSNIEPHTGVLPVARRRKKIPWSRDSNKMVDMKKHSESYTSVSEENLRRPVHKYIHHVSWISSYGSPLIWDLLEILKRTLQYLSSLFLSYDVHEDPTSINISRTIQAELIWIKDPDLPIGINISDHTQDELESNYHIHIRKIQTVINPSLSIQN